MSASWKDWSLSLLIHACFGVLLMVHFVARSPLLVSDSGIRVRPVSEAEYQKKLREALDDGAQKSQQIVQMDDHNKSAKAPDTTEKVYLSKFNQVAVHNQRAAGIGKFHNAPTSEHQHKSSTFKSTAKLEGLFQLTPGTGISATPKPSHQRAPASDSSANDDYLSDVPIGPRTQLNTREFKYYGFFDRLRTSLTDRWRTLVQQELDALSVNDEFPRSTRVTQVIVQIDNHGGVISKRLVGSAGYRGLDRAALVAFDMAAPFPNPPSGMQTKDGIVEIKWDFVVVRSEDDSFHVDVQRFDGP